MTQTYKSHVHKTRVSRFCIQAFDKIWGGEEGRRGEEKIVRIAQLIFLKPLETAAKSFTASTLPSSLIMVSNVALI